MNNTKRVNRPRHRKLPSQKQDQKDENLSCKKTRGEPSLPRMSSGAGSVIHNIDLNTPLLSRLQGILNAKQKEEALTKHHPTDQQHGSENKLNMSEKNRSPGHLADYRDSLEDSAEAESVVESHPVVGPAAVSSATPGSPQTCQQSGFASGNSSRLDDSSLMNSCLEVDKSGCLNKAFVRDASLLSSSSQNDMDINSPVVEANITKRKQKSDPSSACDDFGASDIEHHRKYTESEEFVQSLILSCLPNEQLSPSSPADSDVISATSSESFTSIQMHSLANDGQECFEKDEVRLMIQSEPDLEKSSLVQSFTVSSVTEREDEQATKLYVKRKRSKTARHGPNKRPRWQAGQLSGAYSFGINPDTEPVSQDSDVHQEQAELLGALSAGPAECCDESLEERSSVHSADARATDRNPHAEDRNRPHTEQTTDLLTDGATTEECQLKNPMFMWSQRRKDKLEDPELSLETSSTVSGHPTVRQDMGKDAQDTASTNVPEETMITIAKRRQPRGKGSRTTKAESRTSDSPDVTSHPCELNSVEMDARNNQDLQSVPILSEHDLLRDLVLPFDDRVSQSERQETVSHNTDTVHVNKEYGLIPEAPVTVDSLILPFDDNSSVSSTESQNVASVSKKRKPGRPKGRRSQIYHKVQTERTSGSDGGTVDPDIKLEAGGPQTPESSSGSSTPLTADKESNTLTPGSVVLPFDDEVSVSNSQSEERKCSHSQTDERIQKSRKRKGRRSADFDVMNSVIPSPRTSDSPKDSPSQESYLPLGQPNIRRSRRLKRKSLEIYRAANRKKSNAPAEPDTGLSQSPILSSQDIISPEDQGSRDGSSDDLSLVVKPVEDSEEQTKQLLVKPTDSAEVINEDRVQENITNSDSESMDVLVTEDESSEPDPHAGNEESSPRRSRRKKPEPKAEVQSSKPAPAKRGRKRKTPEQVEPSVEEIYRNKLWRTQMPVEKSWETIYENPTHKPGRDEYQSSKKFKRNIHFDEFYAKNRLKKRRQKALKQGWKPLTSKRDTNVTKLLDEKLVSLQAELEYIEQKIAIDSEQNDCSVNDECKISQAFTGFLPPSQPEEDIFFTPAKSVSDLMAYIKDPADETQSKVDFETLSECTESSSDSQIYQTPLKELSEFTG